MLRPSPPADLEGFQDENEMHKNTENTENTEKWEYLDAEEYWEYRHQALHDGVFFCNERIASCKVDEQSASCVRLQKSPNYVVVFFQPIMSEGDKGSLHWELQSETWQLRPTPWLGDLLGDGETREFAHQLNSPAKFKKKTCYNKNGFPTNVNAAKNYLGKCTHVPGWRPFLCDMNRITYVHLGIELPISWALLINNVDG